MTVVCLSLLLIAFLVGNLSNSATTISKTVEAIAKKNPLNFAGSDVLSFYEHKMKVLLLDAALGMTPAKEWKGRYDANVGYLVARKDGELVCYHFYDIEMVKSHLLDNTKFDTPASNKKAKMENGSDGADQRKPYCILYRNEVGEVEIKLNFQIRWK